MQEFEEATQVEENGDHRSDVITISSHPFSKRKV